MLHDFRKNKIFAKVGFKVLDMVEFTTNIVLEISHFEA